MDNLTQQFASDFMSEFEAEAREQVKIVREYRVYSGANKDYHQRAKIAATFIAAFTRQYASITNRVAMGFAMQRYADQKKALPSG